MNFVLLVVTVFFFGIGNPPQVAVGFTEDVNACQAAGEELKHKGEQDPKVRDIEFSCVPVHQGEKS